MTVRGREEFVRDRDDDKCCRRCLRSLKSGLLLFVLFLGVLGGVGLGILLRFVPPFDDPIRHPRLMMYLYYPADLIIRFMIMLSLPLVVSSLVSGIGALEAKSSGKIGLRTLVYYIGTTIVAVCEGFAFIYAVNPAARGDGRPLRLPPPGQNISETAQSFTSIDALLDMFRNIFPDSIVTASFELTKTRLGTKTVEIGNVTYVIENIETYNLRAMNILGLTSFSIFLGISIASLRDRGRILFHVFDGLFEATMKIIKVALWFYPLAIISMIATTIVRLDDPVGLLTKMFIFVLTVLLGLFVHFMIVLPMIFLITLRRNPYRHMKNCFKAIITAFATCNSNATMPVTLDCLRSAGVNSRVARFMVPIGATVNMDGFALYEAMAAVFIASLSGMNPGPAEIAAVGFTAVAVSIGSPTAGSSIVPLIILFNSIGLPLEDIALLIPFDWFLSRFRTSTNVWGDCIGTAIVAGLSRKELTHAGRSSDDSAGCSLMDGSVGHPEEDGAILTNFAFNKGPKDWTVRLVNESGDRLVVSKV